MWARSLIVVNKTSSERLNRWNRRVLTLELPLVRLRGYRELEAVARGCGFDWVEHAQLRPFLLPPIPRCSLIMGKAPEGWAGPGQPSGP